MAPQRAHVSRLASRKHTMWAMSATASATDKERAGVCAHSTQRLGWGSWGGESIYMHKIYEWGMHAAPPPFPHTGGHRCRDCAGDGESFLEIEKYWGWEARPCMGNSPSHKGRVTHMHARMHEVTVAVYERHTDRWQAHGGVGDRKTLRETLSRTRS